jgi:Plasmid maintenance system killer protein
MDILFKRDKDRALFNSLADLTKKYGDTRAKAILKRLTQIRQAQHLFEFASLPPKPRCHELDKKNGVNRKGQFGIDLDGAWRLVVEPCDVPLPLDDNGKLVWNKICTVRVLSVENYHD